MKIAPVIHAIQEYSQQIEPLLVHTGQHYDENMKQQFFVQLEIPEPDMDLEVGSGSHSVQTAEVMKRFEPVLDEIKADAILVVGDVNSTIACALVAAKKQIPVIHVEAGLRSYDRTMPEEINRILTDQLSTLLYTTERTAADNLAKEGIFGDSVRFVGNVMIDTALKHAERAASVADSLVGVEGSEKVLNSDSGYALLTLHRPANVDDQATLLRLLETLEIISKELPIVFPVHPRTAAQIQQFGLGEIIANSNILQLGPLGYLEMLGFMKSARMVLTDSGGIQEETTALGIPCITLRENTERPITVVQGTNTIVGTDATLILNAFNEVMSNGGKKGRRPELWDGQAAVRIAKDLEQWFLQS